MPYFLLGLLGFAFLWLGPLAFIGYLLLGGIMLTLIMLGIHSLIVWGNVLPQLPKEK
jgi:hypothetical protein